MITYIITYIYLLCMYMQNIVPVSFERSRNIGDVWNRSPNGVTSQQLDEFTINRLLFIITNHYSNNSHRPSEIAGCDALGLFTLALAGWRRVQLEDVELAAWMGRRSQCQRDCHLASGDDGHLVGGLIYVYIYIEKYSYIWFYMVF